jgi:hypothetical protein
LTTLDQSLYLLTTCTGQFTRRAGLNVGHFCIFRIRPRKRRRALIVGRTFLKTLTRRDRPDSPPDIWFLRLGSR